MTQDDAIAPVVDGILRAQRQLPEGRFTVTYRGDGLLAAGSMTRYRVSLVADVALPAGARLALARRWPSDWGTPQWARPQAANFVRVASTPARRVRWWNVRLHAWHPFDHAMIVELLEPLPAGESLDVSFGDEQAGSPGFDVQTFLEEASPLSIRVCAAPGATWTEMVRPVVRIVGTSVSRLVVTVPSRVLSGRRFRIHVRAEDAWGNPAALNAPIHLSCQPAEPGAGQHEARAGSIDEPSLARAAFVLPAEGWVERETSIGQLGIHRFEARAGGGGEFHALSNPVEVVDDEAMVPLAWGDLHAQSAIGCGARSIDDYYRHARDFAAGDFSSHQANCFLVSNDEWRETQRSTRAMNEQGRFVTLLGFEWSAASRLGGDHNLYFPGDTGELRRCSHEFVADKSDVQNDLPHVDDMYAHYRDSDTLVAVHVGGRTADLQFHEPGLDRLVEVHSTHATSEWFLLESLRRGYRMGVVAGSDSVDGRPGASHPGRMGVRNLRGGLTAVAVPELTRVALWDALKARRCYATTGERILLSFRAGTWQMGDEASFTLTESASLPSFDVAVAGTAPIESIDFFRDDRMLLRHDTIRSASRWSDRFRVAWRGASAPGNWQRARMQWDGELRIDGARILAADPWSFDTPDEGLTAIGDHRVAWRSVTAGDWDGVVITLDRPQNALLTFAASPMSLQCPLGDLDPAGWQEEQESPWRTIEIRRLPVEDPPLQCRITFNDPAPQPGRHAYWVRVRQTDGAYAWSTPIFLDLATE